MAFWRDLLTGVAKAGLEAIQKASGPPDEEDSGGNPFKKKDASDGPPGAKDEGSGDGPPAPPQAPPRDLPEPVMGTGPTLAAAPPEEKQKPQTLEQLDAALENPKSLFWDPFAVVDALGYKDRPSPLTFQTLDAMVWRMPIIQSIIKRRVDDVSTFAEVQQDKYGIGFRVQMRDRKARPTPEGEKMSQRLERWMLTTGSTENPVARDSFDAFLKKVVRDTLRYDAMTWEVVPDRLGMPAEFYAVDAATIRIADTTKLFIDPNDKEATRYVQIYDGVVVAEYTSSELLYGVRNPITNLRNQQYGVSELEMLITTITALLWAWDYNQKFFSQGTATKGIINFKGAVPEKQMRAFRRHWYMMTAGVENAYKTPIVNSDDLQWINMQMSNRDMEYNAWMDFLIKVACSVYGMDPMEINFKYGDTGSKTMFESNNAQKLSASKDKGLKPLLKFIELKINQSLIWPRDEDFEFKFCGLDALSQAEQADLNTKLVKTVKTVNEARAEEDMAPLPNGLGDIILDPVYMQHLTLAQSTQQNNDAAQAAADAGMGPEAPEDGPPDDDGEQSNLPDSETEDDGGAGDGQQADSGTDLPMGDGGDGGGEDDAEKSMTRWLGKQRRPKPKPRPLRKSVRIDVEV